MKRLFILVIFCIFHFCFVSTSGSHEIHRTDGTIIISKTVWEEGDTIKYEKYGAVIGISRSEISEIKYDEEVEQELNKNETIDKQTSGSVFCERTEYLFEALYGESVEKYKKVYSKAPEKMIKRKKQIIANYVKKGYSDERIANVLAQQEWDNKINRIRDHGNNGPSRAPSW